MQQYNMTIPNQAGMENIPGACRDFKDGDLHKEDQEKVQAQMKIWEKPVVLRIDGQPTISAPISPFSGSVNTLSYFVALT